VGVFCDEHIRHLHVSEGKEHALILSNHLGGSPTLFKFFSVKLRHFSFIGTEKLLLVNKPSLTGIESSGLVEMAEEQAPGPMQGKVALLFAHTAERRRPATGSRCIRLCLTIPRIRHTREAFACVER
jgi:hypothetical protein